MLVVFYCNGDACKRIHIRTDERSKAEHAYCPRCGIKMKFVSDFATWALCDEEERKLLIKDRLVVSYMSADKKRIVKIGQIKNSQLYYEIKKLKLKQLELKEKNLRLRLMMKDYDRMYSLWKERGVIYHDELWRILTYYEPEKYSRDFTLK